MSENPASNEPLPHNDEAVLKHMEMYQNIISRMANNSSACKNWCIVLVSAFLADLFVITADGALPKQMLKGFSSWATWPVYSGLLLLLFVIVICTGVPLPGKS